MGVVQPVMEVRPPLTVAVWPILRVATAVWAIFEVGASPDNGGMVNLGGGNGSVPGLGGSVTGFRGARCASLAGLGSGVPHNIVCVSSTFVLILYSSLSSLLLLP